MSMETKYTKDWSKVGTPVTDPNALKGIAEYNRILKWGK